MSDGLYPPARPLSVGEALDLAVRIFRVTLVKCLPYGLLMMVVGQLPNIFNLVTAGPHAQLGQETAAWWLLEALGTLGALWLMTAMFLRQRSIAQGRTAATGAELVEALRRLPGTVALFLAAMLVSVLLLAPVAMVPEAYRPSGLLLVAVPLTYLSIALSCAWPAQVLAGQSAAGSIGYSLRLVSGNWWRVATVYTVALAIAAVFYSVATVIVLLVASVLGTLDLAVVTAVATVSFTAISAAAAPFAGAVMLAVLGDLQVRREGTDLQRRLAGLAAE